MAEDRKRIDTLAADVAQMRMMLNEQPNSPISRDEERALKNVLDAVELIATPEIQDFLIAVEREAAHQRVRWSNEHDAGKADADWFWLIGWLAGKAVHATSDDKRLHHIITTAAVCLNWHAARSGASTAMRPGIEPPVDPDEAQRQSFASGNVAIDREGDARRTTPRADKDSTHGE